MDLKFDQCPDRYSAEPGSDHGKIFPKTGDTEALKNHRGERRNDPDLLR
jgi:hypothetical protein